MTSNISKIRMAENEAIFRMHNERIQKGLDEVTQMAKEDGHKDLFHGQDFELSFMCECADENCKQRINLKLSEYREIHKHRKRFILVPGHEVSSIEKVIDKEQEYSVVEKFFVPPTNGSLNVTEVDNT